MTALVTIAVAAFYAGVAIISAFAREFLLHAAPIDLR
jgi:hypothetical protein